MRPVDLVVAARETETSSAAGPLISPGYMLRYTHSRTDMWIGAVSVVTLPAGAVGRYRGQDRRDVFHVLGETHVVIPLIPNSKRLYAPRDEVLRKICEFCLPGRVDGPVSFKVASVPVEHIVARLAFGYLDRVVEHGNSDALFCQRIHFFEVSHNNVPAAAVAVNGNLVSVIKGRRVFGPAVLIDGCIDVGHVFVEAFRQE